MPKVSLTYEGEKYTVAFPSHQAQKADIENLVNKNWELVPGSYFLTYLDMEGDEITAEV